MTVTYRVCAPSVVSEVLDEEAVIMDLRTGNYFSAQGAGCLVWEEIARGASLETVLGALEASYDAPRAQLSGALDVFVAALLEHGLIEPQDRSDEALPVAGTASEKTRPFGGLLLYVHTNMQDLLLLDPIHDVEENLGWPIRKDAPL